MIRTIHIEQTAPATAAAIDPPAATLTIQDSRIVNNSAGSGGGVYSIAGGTTITGSTFSGNTSAQDGAALFVGDCDAGCHQQHDFGQYRHRQSAAARDRLRRIADGESSPMSHSSDNRASSGGNINNSAGRHHHAAEHDCRQRRRAAATASARSATTAATCNSPAPPAAARSLERPAAGAIGRQWRADVHARAAARQPGDRRRQQPLVPRRPTSVASRAAR